ncbi:hypothetical protein A9267_05680 [Shewanella sp. UCD-FRSSP16_17]|uniref:hypothetical protein n=1 Tax=Shewanella sp. UCD-FRSSP16_17 TaxID=1853256 RepID=UPI0007EECAE3|nr:hypothetical protein [Shewanella sp. UCD-FRSSP16_17]OBT10367.1 hypothetical protein A9267_05680 [Shewanella sp. UCD-FRSSP16_17]
MNMLSTYTYNVSSRAKKLPECTISRSQILELIAAYLGKKTYAALKTSSITNLLELLELANKEPLIAFERCKLKAIHLNQSQTSSTQLANLIHDELASLIGMQSSLINKQALYYLTNVDSLTDYDDFVRRDSSESSSRFENESVNKFSYNGFEIDIKNLFTELQQSSIKGDKQSTLLEFLWLLNDLSSVTGGESSQHWYEQSLKGQTMGDTQKKWADNYAKQIKPTQAFERFISQVTISDLAFPNVDDIFEANNSSSIEKSICYLLDAEKTLYLLNQYWGEDYDSDFKKQPFNQWLKLSALQQPNRDIIAELIENSKEPIEQHAWAQFAKENKIDVTQDDHYAINMDTGERWDEDYGPIEVGGYSGIRLPQLAPEYESKVYERSQIMLKINQKYQNRT